MKVETMLSGEVEFPIKLYYCTLNDQILERYPEKVEVEGRGPSLWGTTYPDIRETMVYIGDLCNDIGDIYDDEAE